MAVTYVPKKATALVAATNVATSAPTGSTDGFKLPDDVGVVRTYFDYTGTVTQLNVRLYVREPLSTAWYRSVSTDEINALSPASGDESRDWAVGAGNEFYFTVESISPGSGANTVAIKGAAIDEIGGLIVPRAGQRTASQSAPVTLPSDGPIEVLGTVNGATSLTRLSNATPYTAGDEVSDVASSSAHPFIFANAARANGGAGWITKVRLGSSDPLNVSAIYRLYLFDAAPTMVGDNLAYALLTAEFAIREGAIDLGPMVTSIGAGGSSIDHDVRKRYVCGAASTSLYGILVVMGAYTPLNGGTFQVELTLDRDS